MNITLHKRARITPAIRCELQQSELFERKLAVKYGISRAAVRKWNYHETVEKPNVHSFQLQVSFLTARENLSLLI